MIGFSVKIARVFNAVGVEKSQVENKICGPDIVSNVEVSREM